MMQTNEKAPHFNQDNELGKISFFYWAVLHCNHSWFTTMSEIADIELKLLDSRHSIIVLGGNPYSLEVLHPGTIRDKEERTFLCNFHIHRNLSF